MLERDVENPSKDKARRNGWFVRKYKSPGNRSAPDDLFAKHSHIFFTEFKATGKVPTELQEEEHKKMREAGLVVYWTDSREGFAYILQREEEYIASDRMGRFFLGFGVVVIDGKIHQIHPE